VQTKIFQAKPVLSTVHAGTVRLYVLWCRVFVILMLKLTKETYYTDEVETHKAKSNTNDNQHTAVI